MIFNSIEFIVFFVTFFVIYYSVLKEKTKSQNILLLLASYVFYAYANWKILPLLIVSTLVFYVLGIAVFNEKNQKRKSWLTTLGVVVGVGILLYFKYTNFFISSFKDLFESIGLQTNLHTFNIIIPIGISFYTFRLLSYLIDINRGKYEPTRDIVAFSAYVAFFPCILSGPIDRPNTLIPQLQTKRVFDYALAVDGCRQILWGLFKKAVIADRCAMLTNEIFNNSINLPGGSTLLFGAIVYTFQMYADFSGYSDMAIGISKLLGFKVTRNFNYPFFAQNIADFWRRWHISLTSWLTDYVFMPLNVKWRNWGNWGIISAIIINLLVCGLWHGAYWTFAFFGLYHGLLFIPLILSGAMFKKTKPETYKWGFPKIKTLVRMILTFILVAFGMIIFLADNISQAFDYITNICSSSLFSVPDFYKIYRPSMFLAIFFVIPVLLIIEWLQRTKEHPLKIDNIKSFALRWGIYYALIFAIILFGAREANQFMYFQF
jgi:D-alanyl-lipoteichoic acid acyltransferase DltB (MBOAT superfamily)